MFILCPQKEDGVILMISSDSIADESSPDHNSKYLGRMVEGLIGL